MAKEKLPPPAELAAVCPALEKLVERGPLGPWDDLPEFLELVLPIAGTFLDPAPSAGSKDSWLRQTYGLSERDAWQHVQLCLGDLDALVSQTEVRLVREGTKRPMRGEEYRYIHGAVHPAVRRMRLEEMLPQFEAERRSLQDAAEREYRFRAQDKARNAIRAGHRAYRVRTAALPALSKWWAAQYIPKAPARARAHVFPDLPIAVSLSDCYDTANMVDVKQGFPKMGRMSPPIYVRAAAAAILGAYCQEQQRLGLGGDSAIAVRKIHSSICTFLGDLAAFFSGDVDERAAYVFRHIPGLVLLSKEPKAGRGGNLQDLFRCDTEKVIDYIKWAEDLMRRAGKVPDKEEPGPDVDDDSPLESY